MFTRAYLCLHLFALELEMTIKQHRIRTSTTQFNSLELELKQELVTFVWMAKVFSNVSD